MREEGLALGALQVAGRRKERGTRELDVREMGLIRWCLRKSKTAGALL